MSKKVFVSLPMNNRKDEEILARMDILIKKVQQYLPDAQLLDTFLTDDPGPNIPDAKIALWYLGQSIQKLGE